MTRQELWSALEPEYVAWLRANAGNALENVTAIVVQAAKEGWAVNRFLNNVHGLKSYGTGAWRPQGGAVEEPIPEEAPVEDPVIEDPYDPYAGYNGADVRAELNTFLKQWGLEGLGSFVETAITNHWSANETIVKLRETEAYKKAFPENALRRENGLSWWSESQVLEYRDTARRIAKEYLGVTDITNEEIAGLVAKDVALPEWERRLQTYKSMQQWGPYVKQVLESELGYVITDDRVFAFMNPDISTPELDEAYYKALVRGQPAQLGLGIRPEEEATLLRQFGLSPEEAFKGYQGLASELPRQQRMALIDAHLTANASQFPGIDQMLSGTTQSELFRAIQLKDVDALQEIARRMSHEIARFQNGGGPVRSGTAAVGLLAPAERQ